MQLIDKVIVILSWAIIIRVLLSWFPMVRRNKLIDILYDVTDPLLKPFRRFQIGGPGFALDLSPILALLVLNIIRQVIFRLFW